MSSTEVQTAPAEDVAVVVEGRKKNKTFRPYKAAIRAIMEAMKAIAAEIVAEMASMENGTEEKKGESTDASSDDKKKEKAVLIRGATVAVLEQVCNEFNEILAKRVRKVVDAGGRTKITADDILTALSLDFSAEFMTKIRAASKEALDKAGAFEEKKRQESKKRELNGEENPRKRGKKAKVTEEEHAQD